MITSVQRIAIKKLLGSRNQEKLQRYFKQNGIVNRNNEVYSDGFINQVFNGHKNNDQVEAGIWACVRFHIEKRNSARAEKESLVESINEVVDESAA